MKHFSYLILAIGSFIILQSCVGNRLCPVVTIPLNNNDAPSIAFNIRGPGISETYSISDGWPSGQLNLKSGAVYNFILSCNDESGTRLVQMQIPGEDVLSPTNLTPEGVSVRELSPLSSMLSTSNSESSPRSCIVISGKLNIADIINTSASIGFGAFDFNDNISQTELNIFITDDDDNLGFIEF